MTYIYVESSSENSFVTESNSPGLINLYILITCRLDALLIMHGETSCWSLQTFKRCSCCSWSRKRFAECDHRVSIYFNTSIAFQNQINRFYLEYDGLNKTNLFHQSISWMNYIFLHVLYKLEPGISCDNCTSQPIFVSPSFELNFERFNV